VHLLDNKVFVIDARCKHEEGWLKNFIGVYLLHGVQSVGTVVIKLQF